MAKEEIIQFITTCLNVTELKLERAAIFEESSWLFLEALPRCSNIQKLELVDMKLQVSIPFLLKSISKSLEYLHINNCLLSTAVEEMNVTFHKLTTLKISGKQRATHMLLSPALIAVKILDFREYKSSLDDIKMIAEANGKDYLPLVKHLLIGTDINDSSGHVNILMAHPWLQLQELTLDKCDLNAEDIKAIGRANSQTFLPYIKQISLNHNINISDSMTMLFHNAWHRLGKLEVFECNLTKEDISAIWEANEKGFLPSIDLRVKSLSSSGHVPVVSVMCGAWTEQKVLDLSKGDKQDVIAIVEANRYGLLPAVKKINLIRNKNVSGHVNTLLSNIWPLLKTLEMEECDLIREDIIAIHEANENGILPSIDLTANYLSLSGHIPIVSVMCGAWKELELDLSKCYKFSAQDMRVIAEAHRHGLFPPLDKIEECTFTGDIPVVSIMCGAWKQQEVLNMEQDIYPSQQYVITIAEANKYSLLPSVKEIKGLKNISGQVCVLLSSEWKSLQKLSLRNCDLTVQDITALSEANSNGHLPCMQELVLWGNKNISGHLAVLLSSNWTSLRKLDLYNCNLTAEDLRALNEANSKGHLPCIRELVLFQNDNISGQLAVLLSSHWMSLQKLNLHYCNLIVQDIRALGEANSKGHLPCMQELMLGKNKNISGHLAVLLSSDWMSMQKLSLRYSNLTVDDIRALGEATLPSLKVLDLADNRALEDQLSLPVTNTWPVLEELDLNYCGLTPADGVTLLDASKKGHLPQLRKLYAPAHITKTISK